MLVLDDVLISGLGLGVMYDLDRTLVMQEMTRVNSSLTQMA